MVLAVLLLGLAACRAPVAQEDENGDRIDLSGPQPIAPSLAPIVIPNPKAQAGQTGGRVLENRPVSDEDAGWAEKLALARGYVDGGFEEEARVVLQAAVAQDPPSPWRERFENIKTTLRVRGLETQMLRVDALALRDYASFGSDIDFRIRIRNVSKWKVTLPAPKRERGAGSPTVVNLVIVRRDLDIYGAELRRTWNKTVYLVRPGSKGLEIPWAGQHEDTVRIAAEDVGAAISGIRIIELSGTLRGLLQQEGEEEQSASLRVRPGRVVVLPEGHEPLARRPLASMETAIDTVAPTHLLVAAEFVPRGESDRAMELLARALAEGAPALRTAALGGLGLLRERNVGRPVAAFCAPLIESLSIHPERSEALMEGLTRATGQSLAPDVRLWAEWWRRADREGAVVSPPATSNSMTGGAEQR